MSTTPLPPGPKSKFPLSHLFSFRKDIIGFLRNIASEYGDIAHFNIGPIRIVLLNHPDYIKEVLSTHHKKFIKGRPLEMAKSLLGEGILTSEGEIHRSHSRIIQPAFHRKKIESYIPVITECTNRITDKWKDGKIVDMRTEMTQLSTVIAGELMFHEDVESESLKIIEALDTATKLFGRIPVPFSEYILKLPLPGNIRFFRAKAKLDKLIYDIINKRRKSKRKHDDLLSMLINPYEEEGVDGGLTDEEIRDEALTLFLTAFDTTSTALTWTWYLLSQNPDSQVELHDELDRVLGGKKPVGSDINELRFTRMVFTESMRMFPPTYVIPRQTLEDFYIDKYMIPKGTIILMSPYLIHRDPRYYQDPEVFNPHNWDEAKNRNTSKYEYFPFSGGPRKCIGEPLAWMEGILILATICQSWQAQLVPDHPVELMPLINLRPKYGMLMTLKKRSK